MKNRSKQRYLAKTLLLVISTSLTLLVAEGVLRIAAPPILEGIGTRTTFKAQLYGWAMPPNFELFHPQWPKPASAGNNFLPPGER
jgi:hypothetical protein